MSATAATPLSQLAHWARTTPDAIYLTQPIAGSASGECRDFTWAEALDSVQRVAAHLQAQGQIHGWVR